jgi:hypothetical protein
LDKRWQTAFNKKAGTKAGFLLEQKGSYC